MLCQFAIFYLQTFSLLVFTCKLCSDVEQVSVADRVWRKSKDDKRKVYVTISSESIEERAFMGCTDLVDLTLSDDIRL